MNIQLRTFYGWLLVLTLVLSGCSIISEASDLEEPEEPSTAVVQQSLPTLTSLPTNSPTATAIPSPTSSPTETPEPTATATPEPTPTPDPLAEITYQIEAGETLGQIAERYGLGVDELALYNEMADPSLIEEGALLRVPIGEQRVAEMYATATAVALLVPTPSQELPPRVVMELSHTYQGLNNCAPATTSMVLSRYEIRRTQYEMAAIQKPNGGDKNVTAEEVAVSMRELGLEAYVGYNGNIELVQRLLAAGFPVMTEEWISYDGGMGHFRAIRGYDAQQEAILYNDSYYGPNLWRSYDNFLRDWKPFNNKYIVPYRPEQEKVLAQIIGEAWDEATMYENLRAISTAEVNADPTDGYAWWGLGEALLWQGQYQEAVNAFEQALATSKLPWRYMWYRYGYFEALNRVGRYEDLLALSERTLLQMGMAEDLRYHRAVALRALGRIEEARGELARALQDNPRYAPASLLLEQMEAGS